MKYIKKLRVKWIGVSDTIIRFPLTIVLLVAAAISNIIAIISDENENSIKWVVTFLLGAALFAVLQLLYERFFDTRATRMVFMGITIAFSIIYYILIINSNWEVEVTIRTMVIAFILLVAFLWIPVIKSKNNFNESFMAVFKGFFISVFFTGVLFLGVALVFWATDMLIASVDDKAYLHSANIIFILFAPIYFLSLIPYYPRKENLETLQKEKPIEDSKVEMVSETVSIEEMNSCNIQARREEALVKFTSPARFLETLISYVIIPITAVFTIILVLYIIMNITGEFWTDNLMEPMLVSYSIIVIIVYLLAGTIDNASTRLFRKSFPKVLVPVVLFQTLSSVLKIGEIGVTYGRYYVILFGLFATIAGILFCVVPVRKNGIIAPILIVLSMISIVPPVDAFTVSKANQIGKLENILKKNDMLNGETITPNGTISKEDKQNIVTSINYLNRMQYTKDIEWLSDYNKSMNFENTFGFLEYDQQMNQYKNIYIGRDLNSPIPISGYDYMLRMNINSNKSDIQDITFKQNGKGYTLSLDSASADKQVLVLKEKDGQELIQFAINDIFVKFTDKSLEKTAVPTEEVTFTQDNSVATLTVVADTISVNEWLNGRDQSVDINILVKIK